MTDRVYLLLNVPGGKSAQVVDTLKNRAGVKLAEMLEGPPDVILMIEASSRQKLAERAVRAIAAAEDMIENIRLLPTVEKTQVLTTNS